MNEEQHTHELIDQYLQGQMIGEDMDLFRIRMKEDKAFLHQVQLQKALIEHIEKEREADLRKIFKSKSKRRGALIIPFNRRILSVAAVLLAITALAMVLKMYLPETNVAEDLTTTQEPTLDSNELNKAMDEGVVEAPDDSIKSTVTNPTPSTEMVEEADDVEEEENPKNMFSENDDKEDLSDLKNQEIMLDATNIKPQKDVLLTTKKLVTMNYPVATNKSTTTKVESNDVRSTSAESISRKDKILTDDAIDKASSAGVVDSLSGTSSALIANGKTITVEYWKSVVNFKGYHYNGKVLMLYEVAPESKIQVVNYDGKTFLKWGGAVYRIVNNDQYEPFSRVTDSNILNVINK